jgi:MFS family permease
MTFFALLVTQALSLLGSRMTAVAVGIWVYTTTQQTTPLLLTAFFTELPGMAAGSLAGVLVDRWNRKRVLILADVGQAAGSMLLLVCLLSGRFQLWQLYVAALVQGTFAALQGPAESATVTLLVPERHRERANGIQALAHPLAGVVAPALVGLLYAPLGVVGVIAVDLLTFFAAALIVAALHIPHPPVSKEGAAARGGLLREWRGGMRFVRERPPLLFLVLFLTLANFLWNGPLDLQIPYFLALTGSERLMGTGVALASLGAFAGGALVALVGGYRPRMRLMLICLAANGVMFLVFALADGLPALGTAVFLLFLPLPMIGALFSSLVQVKAPPDVQGRVFAVQGQLALLGSTTSFLLVGPLVDRVLAPLAAGPPWATLAPWLGEGASGAMRLLYLATGVILLAATALTFARREVRRLEAELPDYGSEAEARPAITTR